MTGGPAPVALIRPAAAGTCQAGGVSTSTTPPRIRRRALRLLALVAVAAALPVACSKPTPVSSTCLQAVAALGKAKQSGDADAVAVQATNLCTSRAELVAAVEAKKGTADDSVIRPSEDAEAFVERLCGAHAGEPGCTARSSS